MNPSPAEIFRRNPDLAPFQAGVRALDGAFTFDREAMIALGEAYFERHPETSHGRDSSAVLLGYALVRTCLVEKVVEGLSAEGRDFYRAALLDASQAGPRLQERLGRRPAASRGTASLVDLWEEHRIVSAAVNRIKAMIEDIPRGPIKERFVGGISNLYNILYLIKMNLDRADEVPA